MTAAPALSLVKELTAGRDHPPFSQKVRRDLSAVKGDNMPDYDDAVSVSSSSGSRTTSSVAQGPAMKPRRRPKQQTPQQAIDEFWAKFTSKTPGKGMCLPITVLYNMGSSLTFILLKQLLLSLRTPGRRRSSSATPSTPPPTSPSSPRTRPPRLCVAPRSRRS